MSRLTTDKVMELFDAKKIVDVPAPTYAVGGAALDDNKVPGFAVENTEESHLARAMLDEPYKSDLSVPPLEEGIMAGGRRRSRRRRSRKQAGGRRTGKKQPRFQLTLKASVRLRSRSRSRQQK